MRKSRFKNAAKFTHYNDKARTRWQAKPRVTRAAIRIRHAFGGKR